MVKEVMMTMVEVMKHLSRGLTIQPAKEPSQSGPPGGREVWRPFPQSGWLRNLLKTQWE